MRKLIVLGSMFILIGIVLMLIALYLEEISAAPIPALNRILFGLAEGLGTALVSLGIVGIIINLADWRRYFQERLAETIVQRPYLRRLGKSELIELQTNTLKAFFDADEIDREGSFLHYFHSKIRELIASPFREHLNNVINISESPERNLMELEETISWECRGVKGEIQPFISWTPEEGEFQEVRELEVSLRLPAGISINLGKDVADLVDKDGRISFSFDTLQKKCKVGRGYQISLEEFRTADGLQVKIHARYMMRRNRFIGWAMAHPTKGLHLTIKHPENWAPVHELFAIEEEEVHIDKRPGLFQLRSESWILTGAGLVIQLAEESPGSSSIGDGDDDGGGHGGDVDD